MIVYTPPADILPCPHISFNDTINQADIITNIFYNAGIQAHCLEYCNAPQVVTYFYNLENVLDITKVKRLLLPLKTACNAPNLQITDSLSSHFAIQIPNQIPDIVYFKDALLTKTFDSAGRYAALLGRDTNNNTICINLENTPHILIAGATGAGKSVLLNTMITSLLFKCYVKLNFLMIDIKRVELTKFNKIPHLMQPVITEPKTAIKALKNICGIMDKRYKKMARKRLKTWEGNKIIVVIDELADLMVKSKKEVEKHIIRIAQLGRAAGIHLIIATQRPTVNVITGMIKANMSYRIALQTSSARDSMNIIDHKGAEQLKGRGDAILKTIEETRFQAAYTSDEDIQSVVNYYKRLF